ncbi:MAG: hypothetical protein ACI35S_06185 [Anaeroplasma sp.]
MILNKFKKIFTLICILGCFIILSACGGSKSGVDAEMSYVAARDKIVINVVFNDNEHLKSGKANPHIKIYTLASDGTETYKNEDKSLSFSNDVYTESSVTFSSLAMDTSYVFYLYVTFNGKDEKLGKLEAKTLASGTNSDNATIIKNKEEFLAMTNDPEAYYSLESDIDFDGATMDVLFKSSSANQFKGTFDGNGHTIKNFKLKSETNVGIFGYTNGATIKNLNVENVNADFSSGLSSANVGVLVGSANRTIIENCSVKDITYKMQCNTTAEVNVGGAIGLADNVYLHNVSVTNASITFTRARLKLSAGLFVGKLKGDAMNNDNVLVDGCHASGSISANCYYISNEGYTFVGGFVGNLGSSALIKNSYAVADIVVTKTISSSYDYKFILAVGGFMGINNEGSINISGCATVADIDVYAGNLPEEGSIIDYSDEVMCKKNAYIGGFAGKTIDLFARIENSCYVIKETGIYVNAAEKDDDRDYLYVNETIGLNTDKPAKVVNVFSSNSSNADYSIFNEEIKNIINQYINK